MSKAPKPYPQHRANPPEKFRFKPGQSGNPKGRPKKQPAPKLDPLQQAFQDALIEESARPVTVNEGGKQITLPAHQAVLRAAHVAAIKGSAQAQRTLLQAYFEVERRAQAAHAASFGKAIELKILLEGELQKWVAAGRREEDIPFHPSDIEINYQTLEVLSHLPITAEQLKARADMIELRDELLKSIAIDVFVLGEVGENEVLSSALSFSRGMVAEMNEALPPRYRKDRHVWSPLRQRRQEENSGPDLTRQSANAQPTPSEEAELPGDSGCPS
jgi:hypothetical protein